MKLVKNIIYHKARYPKLNVGYTITKVYHDISIDTIPFTSGPERAIYHTIEGV